MKQAILITAYRDLGQLQRLVEYFDDDFELFIHLDKKCREDYRFLEGKSQVHLYRCYKIAWGDVNHLFAILLLMKEAYVHKDLEFFHLITGSDYPILSLQKLKSYCENHRQENYLEFFPLPRQDWGVEGGLQRIKYWWLLPSARVKGGKLIEKSIKWQRRLGICRSFKYFDGNIYGGGTYWSVSRQAVEVALDFIQKNPDYLLRFRMTSIAEEICLPTLWANSGLHLINNYMRYIDWGFNGADPKILTEKDYDKVVASGALFMRKVQTGISDKLIELLDHDVFI